MTQSSHGPTVYEYASAKIVKLTAQIDALMYEKRHMQNLCLKYAASKMTYAEYAAAQAEPFQSVLLPRYTGDPVAAYNYNGPNPLAGVKVTPEHVAYKIDLYKSTESAAELSSLPVVDDQPV